MNSESFCPSAGCVVEFLQDNQVQCAWVLECAEGRARLFTLQLREVNMPLARILPWQGPKYEGTRNREEIISLLHLHSRRRESLSNGVNPALLWELTNESKESAGAEWFAELAFSNIADNWLIDGVAAVGKVLLESKTYFRFNPPLFELNTPEQVEARLSKQVEERERAALLEEGRVFFQGLWEVHLRRRERAEVLAQLEPKGAARSMLLRLLHTVLSSPQEREQNQLWRKLSKNLGDGQHLPLFLAVAWGLVPEHYNFWFDRADYNPDPAWSAPFSAEVETIRAQASALAQPMQLTGSTGSTTSSDWDNLFSIDSTSTKDIDDAFSIEALPEESGGGFLVRLALACPALLWPFTYAQSGLKPSLDVQVLQRASSIYLPEGSFHMMPETLATDILSLRESELKPALLAKIEVDAAGNLRSCSPHLGLIRVAANLSFSGCEAVLERLSPLSAPGSASSQSVNAPEPNLTKLKSAAEPYTSALLVAEKLSRQLREARIKDGAVIIEKPETEIHLSSAHNAHGENLPEFWNSWESDWWPEKSGGWPEKSDAEERKNGNQPNMTGAMPPITSGQAPYWQRWAPWAYLRAEVLPAPAYPRTQLLVGELMVLANKALTSWSSERGLPIFYRTQDVKIDPASAGEWTDPADIARVIKGLSGAQLELEPKPHVGIGCTAYASFSSPLRRYVDLINERQILSALEVSDNLRQTLPPEIVSGLSTPFSKETLTPMLAFLNARLEAATQVQRFRTRYLKLLGLKQAGESLWHEAVVTEVRDPFVFVSLTVSQIIVRGKRSTFGPETRAGQKLQVRLGKIHPLHNEINILEATNPPACWSQGQPACGSPC